MKPSVILSLRRILSRRDDKSNNDVFSLDKVLRKLKMTDGFLLMMPPRSSPSE